ATCPDHWTTMGDYCYRVFTDKSSWEEAELKCMEHGYRGHLATVNSAEDQDILDGFLVYMLGERGDTGFFWMDLSNQEDESTFKFSN
ncbi:hypothetical protein CAPTEDRAFT_37057, partial [Capitella teleta]